MTSKSKVYTLKGETQDIDIHHNGVPLFRKMTTSAVEIEIAKILMTNPHKNIVNIYAATQDYIDMELLNTDLLDVCTNTIKPVMKSVKKYLSFKNVITCNLNNNY